MNNTRGTKSSKRGAISNNITDKLDEEIVAQNNLNMYLNSKTGGAIQSNHNASSNSFLPNIKSRNIHN